MVTNSIVIAEELRTRDNISVILLGGEMDDKGNCYDAIAIETIKRLRFDKCFITSAFISAQFGLSIQKTAAISFFNAVMDSAVPGKGLFPGKPLRAGVGRRLLRREQYRERPCEQSAQEDQGSRCPERLPALPARRRAAWIRAMTSSGSKGLVI